MILRDTLLVLLCCWTGQAYSPDMNQQLPSIKGEEISADFLAQTLIDQHDALTAISLIYTQVPESGEGSPAGGYLRRFVAARRDGMFIRDNSHGHNTLSWTDDLTRKTLVVTPDGSTMVENLNRCVQDLNIQRSGEPPKSISGDFIFEILCWWPFVNWSPPQYYAHAFSMRELLKEGVYQLSPQKEMVGSRLCYTFKVNDDYTVWCDCDRVRCVLKSEIRNPETKSLAARFEMMDHQQLSDGIWLPGRFRIVRFDSEAHSSQLRERVVYDRTFLVSDTKVNNNVSASIFRRNYDPGTIRMIELANEIRYDPVSEGQDQHFESILQWSRLFFPRLSVSRDDHSFGRHSIFFIFVSLGCGCVIVASCTRFSPRK